MARISRRRVSEFLKRGDRAQTPDECGAALEDLICYVFDKVPGITVTCRNEKNAFHTEEIDIAFWNERPPNGFHFLQNVILVECKNWTAPVGSEEVAWFDRKLADRGLTDGVLVAANGVTGDARKRTDAHSIIASALSAQRRLVVVTRAEIEELGDSADLVELVKVRLCELAVHMTVFL